MGSLPSFLCRAQPGNDYACKSVMFYGAAMETRFRTPVVEVGNSVAESLRVTPISNSDSVTFFPCSVKPSHITYPGQAPGPVLENRSWIIRKRIIICTRVCQLVCQPPKHTCEPWGNVLTSETVRSKFCMTRAHALSVQADFYDLYQFISQISWVLPCPHTSLGVCPWTHISVHVFHSEILVCCWTRLHFLSPLCFGS